MRYPCAPPLFEKLGQQNAVAVVYAGRFKEPGQFTIGLILLQIVFDDGLDRAVRARPQTPGHQIVERGGLHFFIFKGQTRHFESCLRYTETWLWRRVPRAAGHQKSEKQADEAQGIPMQQPAPRAQG